jgi:hypothetical protein
MSNLTPEWTPEDYPWYKRYPKDLLSSARIIGMTHLQRSIYYTLLDRAWVEDGLPSDPEQLALLALCTPAELDEAWVFPLNSAFEESSGRLRNRRMEGIRVESITLRSKRSRGGQARPNCAKQESSKSVKSLSEASLCREKEREKENTPLPPSQGGLDSLDSGGEALLATIKAVCPKGRYGRQSLSKLAPWAAEWRATGHSDVVATAALGRYRRMDDNGDRFPAVEVLAHHASVVFDEAMRDAEGRLSRQTGPGQDYTPRQRRVVLRAMAEVQLHQEGGV